MTLISNVLTDQNNRIDERNEDIDVIQNAASDALIRKRALPQWAKEQMNSWGERFCLSEWDDDDDFNDEENDVDSYRVAHGWKGRDLCHSKSSPVRISHYAIQYTPTGIGTTLTGLAHFTPHAESHAGYCHGGSMTSVMDDVIGWTAFHVTGRCCAWSGYTAQINVKLMKPVAVGSVLKIFGRVCRWERRKVWVEAGLVAVEEEGEVEHCTAEGLVILKRES